MAGTSYFNGEDGLAVFARTLKLDCRNHDHLLKLKSKHTRPPSVNLWRLFEQLAIGAGRGACTDLVYSIERS